MEFQNGKEICKIVVETLKQHGGSLLCDRVANELPGHAQPALRNVNSVYTLAKRFPRLFRIMNGNIMQLSDNAWFGNIDSLCDADLADLNRSHQQQQQQQQQQSSYQAHQLDPSTLDMWVSDAFSTSRRPSGGSGDMSHQAQQASVYLQGATSPFADPVGSGFYNGDQQQQQRQQQQQQMTSPSVTSQNGSEPLHDSMNWLAHLTGAPGDVGGARDSPSPPAIYQQQPAVPAVAATLPVSTPAPPKQQQQLEMGKKGKTIPESEGSAENKVDGEDVGEHAIGPVLYGILVQRLGFKWFIRGNHQPENCHKSDLYFVSGYGRHFPESRAAMVGDRVSFRQAALEPNPNPSATEVKLLDPLPEGRVVKTKKDKKKKKRDREECEVVSTSEEFSKFAVNGCAVLLDQENFLKEGKRYAAIRTRLPYSKLDDRWQVDMDAFVTLTLQGKDGEMSDNDDDEEVGEDGLKTRPIAFMKRCKDDKTLIRVMSMDLGGLLVHQSMKLATAQPIRRTYIIATGNNDYFDVVKTCLYDGMNVELWAWGNLDRYRALLDDTQVKGRLKVFGVENFVSKFSTVTQPDSANQNSNSNSGNSNSSNRGTTSSNSGSGNNSSRNSPGVRCLNYEFCLDGLKCLYQHSDAERKLFAASRSERSPYTMFKFRDCENAECTQKSARRADCFFLHVNEGKFCKACCEVPCVGKECANVSQRRKLISELPQKLKALYDKNYLRFHDPAAQPKIISGKNNSD